MGRPFFLLSFFLIWAMIQSAEAPMTEAFDHPPFLLTTSGSVRLIDIVQSDLESKQYDDARESLRALRKRNDGMIAAAYYRTDIALREAIDAGTEEKYQAFFKESDHFRRLVRKAPMSVGIDYLRGESERQLFIVHAARGENLRAIFALRTSLVIFEKLIDRHPEYTESYGSLGLLHVTLATLPANHRKVFAVLGLKATVQQGIIELNQASSSSRYAASGAREALAILSRYEVSESAHAELAMSTLRDTQADRPMAGIILGDILRRSSRSRQVAPPVMSILPDQHLLLSGNVSEGFQAIYSSDG